MTDQARTHVSAHALATSLSQLGGGWSGALFSSLRVTQRAIDTQGDAQRRRRPTSGPRRRIASTRAKSDRDGVAPTLVGAEVPVPRLTLETRDVRTPMLLGSTTLRAWPVLTWSWRPRTHTKKGAVDARRSRMQKPLVTDSFYVSSPFGPRWGRMHKGVDLATQLGEPVVAADDGVVSFAGYDDGYGHVVEITHDDKWRTLYAHLDRADSRRVGTRVACGERIASVGMSGTSSGPHLHFEVQEPIERRTGAPLTSDRSPEGQAPARIGWLASGLCALDRARSLRGARSSNAPSIEYRTVDPALYLPL
ncbi:peptidase_M23 domain-containing protein [Pseudoscourfieldia marina]